jgi:polysaccharide export outer membrane protein
MKSIFYSVMLGALMWMSSCKTAEKTRQQLLYFKNIKDSALQVATAYEPVIQKGDILSILASGSILEKEAAQPILESINMSAGSGSSTSAGTTATAPTGYLVNEAGDITVPFLGAVPVMGLTRIQAAQLLRDKLKKEITDPIVEVRFLNHKFTVLGEVGRPGPQPIINDRVTIIDAIGGAGDLTINGKRDNIMIIRDNNGKKEIGHLNLNEGNIFSSPYYFIRPDDIVYVEMNKLTIPERQNDTLRYIQLGLAVITSISLLINLFK